MESSKIHYNKPASSIDNFQQIRILFLTSVLDSKGGSEKNILNLAGYLPKERFQPYVMAFKGGVVLEEVKRLGIYAEEIALKSIFSLNGLVKGMRLFRFLQKEKIDVMVTYHEDADIWGGVIGKLAGVPVILSNKRDMGYQINWKHRLAYRFLNRWFNRFIAVSNAVKQELIKTQHVPPSKIEVIYNGVDIRDQKPSVRSDYLHHLLDIPRQRQIVGMVASFRPVKGQEYFVRAAAKVLKYFPDVDFVIVGYKDTDYYHEVSQLNEELGIADRVHCIGTRTDVWNLLRSMDIFVISSLHEGFSNAILEAMEAGLPVIAPESGGNNEIVGLDNGILCAPGSIDEFAGAILKLLQNPEEKEKMGKRARQIVTDKFSLERMIRHYEEEFVSECQNVGKMEVLYRPFDISSEDVGELIRLMEKTYGVPVNKARWSWVYQKHPRKENIKVYVAQKKDEIIACTSRLPVELRIRNKTYSAYFNMDSVVEPRFRHRGIMTGLYKYSACMLPVMYSKGTNPEMYNILLKLGYNVITPSTTLVAFLSPLKWLLRRFNIIKEPAPVLNPDLMELDEFCKVKEFGSEFDEFWKRAAGFYSGIVVKDSAYMNWRYVDVPHIKYSMFYRMRSGQIVSCIVVRTLGVNATIVDMIWDPLEKFEPFYTIRFVKKAIRKSGFVKLSCWATLTELRKSLKKNGFMDLGDSLRFSVSGDSENVTIFSQTSSIHFMNGDGDSEFCT
jgi:L-malate glycosyltransferase